MAAIQASELEQVRAYEADLHAQAAELDRQADLLRAALLAPSMRETDLREQAEHLRNMAK